MTSVPAPLRRAAVPARLGASGVLLGLGIAAVLATPHSLTSTNPDGWNLLSLTVPAVAFAVVGAFVSLRLPGNAVGWIMATIGLAFSVVVCASATARWGLVTGSLSTRAAEWSSGSGRRPT